MSPAHMYIDVPFAEAPPPLPWVHVGAPGCTLHKTTVEALNFDVGFTKGIF